MDRDRRKRRLTPTHGTRAPDAVADARRHGEREVTPMEKFGYKRIIGNMVERGVVKYVENKADGKLAFAYPVEGTLKLSVQEKDVSYPLFSIDVTVKYNRYSVHGFIDEYGTVYVTTVRLERDRIIDLDRTDWHAEDNIRHVTEVLYGEKLEAFKFDR